MSPGCPEHPPSSSKIVGVPLFWQGGRAEYTAEGVRGRRWCKRSVGGTNYVRFGLREEMGRGYSKQLSVVETLRGRNTSRTEEAALQNSPHGAVQRVGEADLSPPTPTPSEFPRMHLLTQMGQGPREGLR
jgi:hypothetical protein